MHDSRAQLERLLIENQLAFWKERAVDQRDGGYHVNYDLRGRWRGRADKYLVSQTRMLWYFSRLARSPYGDKSHRHLARHGFDFLRGRMWDEKHGGFFWQTSSSGDRIIRHDKHIYGQAFGLFALSEFALSTGNTAAATLARELFELLEQRAHDPHYGGYVECFAPDWSLSDADTDCLGHPRGMKSLNTHLHLLEALLRYVVLDRDPLVRERLRELREIVCNRMLRRSIPEGASGINLHTRDFTDVGQNQRASYGHDIELAWLLLDAGIVLDGSESATVEVARALFTHAARFGFDTSHGGFYDSGPPHASADRRVKVWWVEAEAMLSALRLYRATALPQYSDYFSQTLRWIVMHQADWRDGEWFDRIDERGKPNGDKANAWKDPYHNGRALLESLHLMPESSGSI